MLNRGSYFVATLLGVGAGFVSAIILSVLGILLESEYSLLLCLGLCGVGGVFRYNAPEKYPILRGLISFVLCVGTYFLYQLIMAVFGYYYEENFSFWGSLITAAIIGIYTGCHKDDIKDSIDDDNA